MMTSGGGAPFPEYRVVVGLLSLNQQRLHVHVVAAGTGGAGRPHRTTALAEERKDVAEAEFASVGEYIASFPAEVRPVLEDVRRAIHDAVPGAGEAISYGIAAITLDGTPLLHFAGWKRHVSLYPVPAGDAEFERRLEPYRSGKSTLKFLLSEPVPIDVIADVARHHAEARAGG